MVVSAHSSVVHLVYQLGQVEWGPLSAPCLRGTRAILDAIARTMFARRVDLVGEVDVTAEQLMRTSGYGLRWTRQALHTLEDAGVIEWKRGGIRDGKPETGIIRIVKRVLCQWIRDELPGASRRERKRRQRTARRIERLHSQNLNPRLRRSAHMAVAANLSPYRGGNRRPRKGGAHTLPPRKENKMMRTYEKLNPTYLPIHCRHGIGRPIVCPQCRDIALATQLGIESRPAREKQLTLTTPPPSTQSIPVETATRPALSVYERYMRQTYPDLTPRHWPDVEQTDATARRLAVDAYGY